MAMCYRADHVGSLLRPAALVEARAAYTEGRLGLDALRQAEDSAVLEAMRLQRDVGLGIFTDGEYRRGSWLTDLADAVEGFVPDRVLLEWHGPGGGTEASTARVAVRHCGRRGDSRRMRSPSSRHRRPVRLR
jgi:5-methyltetrahydropteroyltriglutamate--homocysteine methyltransferase